MRRRVSHPYENSDQMPGPPPQFYERGGEAKRAFDTTQSPPAADDRQQRRQAFHALRQQPQQLLRPDLAYSSDMDRSAHIQRLSDTRKHARSHSDR